MQRFHVAVGSGKNVAKRWRDQYGESITPLYDGTIPRDVLRKLEALKKPTKAAVNAIIGDNGWTDI